MTFDSENREKDYTLEYSNDKQDARNIKDKIEQYIQTRTLSKSFLLYYIPILGTLLSYIVGQLFMMRYFFQNNFVIMDIIIHPLPIKYGHTLFIGALIMLYCIAFMGTLIYILALLKKADRAYAYISVISILFFFLNVLVVFLFVPSSSPLEYIWKTLIFMTLMLLLVGISCFILKMLLNVAVSAWSFALWITLTLIVISLAPNNLSWPSTILNSLFIISYIPIFYMVGSLLNRMKKVTFTRIEDVIKRETIEFENNSLTLKAVLITTCLIAAIALAFSFTSTSIPALNNFTNESERYDNIVLDEDHTISGNYIGTADGIHYYIDKNKELVRTSADIQVYSTSP